MEKQQKKQILKYIYFLCIGMVFGFLFGSISRHDNNNTTNNKVDSYEQDTVYSVDGWYNQSSLPDSILNETVIP